MYSSIRRSVRTLVEGLPDDSPASSTAISPTCARSSWKTRSRSARISSWARRDGGLGFLLGRRLEVDPQLVGGLAGFLDDAVRLALRPRELRPVVS